MLQNTLIQHVDALRSGTYSSVELTQTYLDRIAASKLNSFVSVHDNALNAAVAADEARSKGDDRALLGIPIAHKDIFCEQGTRTTAGSKMLNNFIAPYDATVVSRLAAAGVVSLGKTNMDEFAMGSSTETSYHGAALNPWDTERVPGGSSGGSAVAVAAHLCAAATGTDTGGSIRQPAGFCGITGMKPTYGRVSRWGIIAYASSLDQAGPMARTAEDCALLLQFMAGHDNKDSTSASSPLPNYLEELNASVSGTTIGLCKEYMDDLDEDMATIVESTATELEKLGAKIKTVSLPNSEHAIPSYYIIAPAECSANLSRYDGVRFGHRCEQPADLADLYSRSRSEGFGTEVKNRIMVGTFALSAGYFDAYYRKAQQIRRLIKNDFQKAFVDVDAILAPTSPGPAFRIGDNQEDPKSMYQQDIFTISANLAGIPAIAFPAGTREGLPVGAQLLGNYFNEAKLLNLTHQYQQVTGWHLATAGNFS